MEAHVVLLKCLCVCDVCIFGHLDLIKGDELQQVLWNKWFILGARPYTTIEVIWEVKAWKNNVVESEKD